MKLKLIKRVFFFVPSWQWQASILCAAPQRRVTTTSRTFWRLDWIEVRWKTTKFLYSPAGWIVPCLEMNSTLLLIVVVWDIERKRVRWKLSHAISEFKVSFFDFSGLFTDIKFTSFRRGFATVLLEYYLNRIFCRRTKRSRPRTHCVVVNQQTNR